MNWIDKLERKFGRFGVENLTMYVIICYVVGYFLAYFNPSLLSMLSLEPALILRGQIWRIITWVIYPPRDILIMIIKSTSRDTSCFGDIGYGDPVRSFLLYEFKKSSQDGFVRHRISFIRNWILHSRFPPISHKYSVTVQYPHSYGSKCLLNSYNIVQYNTDPEV